jgi:dCMP deaminase
MTRQEWWDRWFLGMAEYVASASKDPSTRTGAVIVDGARRVVGIGYNGFPRGVKDLPERYADRSLKYKMVVHCERNAILFARGRTDGCTLYTWPFMSCSVCAGMVINAGIVRCVAPAASSELLSRWGEDLDIARTMFEEAGVELCIIPG